MRIGKIFLLVCAALCLAMIFNDRVFGDEIARHGKAWVKLLDAPCTNEKVVAVIKAHEANPADFRAGVGFFGVEYQLCWIKGPESVGLVYEDGSVGGVGNDEFEKGSELPNT